MERSVAVRKLHKMLGKGFGYRVNLKAPDQAERDQAKAELKGAVAERDKLKAERDKRYSEILAADAEYQQRQAAYKAARDRCEKLSGMQHSYRVTVGHTNSVGGFGFFHVKAQGDSWEEVIEKVKKA